MASASYGAAYYAANKERMLADAREHRMVKCRPPLGLLTLNLVGDAARVSRATCVKCGEAKSLDQFHKTSAQASATDVRTDCKACFSIRVKEYRATHKTEIQASVKKHISERAKVRVLSLDDRVCAKCKVLKPVTAFSKDYQTVSGYHASCSVCVKVQRQTAGYWSTFYARHKADIIKATTEYARTHPEVHAAKQNRRRASNVRAAGSCSTEQLKARFEFYGNCCAYCGGPAETSDHVIALVRGGSNWPANIRPACTSCNSSKGAKRLFNEWKPSRSAA